MKHESIIESLVEALNSRDVDAFLSHFENDAHVIDSGEKQDITGVREIKKWFEETNARFKFNTQILESEKLPTGFHFLALVSGNFPGSPIRFSYTGKMGREKIQELDIAISSN